MNILKWASLLILTFMVAGLAIAHPDDKKYELSEVQKLRLQVKQKDAQLAQIQLSIAQGNFEKTIDDFNAEVKSIEKENSWPETLQINAQTLDFTAPPATAPPPEKPLAPIPATK